MTKKTFSAVWQPMKFGVTPPKFQHSRREISKTLPFLHLQERFGPDVMDFIFGTGHRNP
jgi:hypothetical protein